MARITTIINQKGGVGKTSTAAALAAGLNASRHKTLAVDADAQCSLTYIMGADAERGIYEAMTGTDAAQLILHTEQGDILPSTPALIGADLEFTKTGREYIFRDLLEPIQGKYSHIVIDCPPQLGIMAVNALTASDDVIIPMGADILSLQGLGQLCDTINTVKKYCNPRLKIAGLLITRFSKRAVLSRDFAEVIEAQAKALQTTVYKTQIREGIAVKESQTMRTSLYQSHPKANPTADYKSFVKEYLKQEDKKK